MDIFDLEDWCEEHHPEFLNAIRYLHMDTRYDSLLELYNKNESCSGKASD